MEKRQELQKRIEGRIDGLRRSIAALDVVVTGTLLLRRMVCGKSVCRCKKNKKWRHGPYHDWTRLENGRLVHKYLSPEEAELVKRGIKNYRTLLKVSRQWESETIRMMEVKKQN